MTGTTASRAPFFTPNLTLRVLSLALALVIWCMSAASRPREVRLTLPVRLVHLPPGFGVTGSPPPAVRVTLTAPLHRITTVTRQAMALTLDLEGAARPGITSFTHLENHLALPDGVRVTAISPASLDIRLEATTRSEGEHHP